MRRVFAFAASALFATFASGFPNSAVYVGDVGARTVTITNSGPLGGTHVTTMPIAANQKFKVWFSPLTTQIGASVTKGSEQACPVPCAVSLNMELGRVGRMYEITDSTGTSYDPAQISAWDFLPLIPHPDYTAPFTVPMPITGFRGLTKYVSFSVPAGEATNDLSVLEWTNNLRNGIASVITSNGTEHVIKEVLLTDVSSNGSACAVKTKEPNTFVAGNTVWFNRFDASNGAGINLNLGTYTVLANPVPTSSGFSVTCNLASGTYTSGGQAQGQTASRVFQYVDERRWWGGLHGNRQALLLKIPVASGEFTANATNRLGFRYLGRNVPSSGIVDGLWLLDWNVIHAPIEITQIVVSGANATATLTSAVPASWTVGRTVYVWDAPGPRWRFNGRRVITGVAGSTFTFAWGSDIPGETPGVAPYTTVNGTYTVPTSQDTTQAAQPHMYAALAIVPKSSFQYMDPSTFNYGSGNAANGKTLLTTNLPGVSSFGCPGCHVGSEPGFDYKYFNVPPETLKAGGMGVGRSEAEMNDIIAYVGTVSARSTKGRWWNPPYQPCPGLDSAPVTDWAAGCGQEWVLTYDKDMGEYITPGGAPPDWTVASGASYANWFSGTDIKIHEQPMPVILPHWVRWLPEKQPENVLSSLGGTWSTYPMYTEYLNDIGKLVKPQPLASGISTAATTMTTAATYACTNNDFIQLESGVDVPEYVKVTAGCNTTSMTIQRNCEPIGGTCTGTGTAHTTAAYLADFSAYKRSGYMLNMMLDGFTNPSTGFSIVYKMANGSSPLVQGPGWNTDAQPACWYPTTYLPNYYAVLKWIGVRVFESVAVFGLQDVYDKASLDYSGLTSSNARVAPLLTRGYNGYNLFGNGPHKTTGCDFYFLNTGQVSKQNHDLDSAIWYILADIVTNDNRFNYQFGPIDWNYYSAFNTGLSTYRPMFYMQLVQVPYQLQQTLGWPDLMANGSLTSVANSMQLGASYTFNFRFSQLFTSQTVVGDAVKQIALVYADLFPKFTAAQWITYLNNQTVNTCQGNQPAGHPSVVWGMVYGSCLSDYVAYGLALMKYYGADSTSLNAIVNWANSITGWRNTGYDFNRAIGNAAPAAGCSMDNSQPPGFVRCHD